MSDGCATDIPDSSNLGVVRWVPGGTAATAARGTSSSAAHQRLEAWRAAQRVPPRLQAEEVRGDQRRRLQEPLEQVDGRVQLTHLRKRLCRVYEIGVSLP